jgi:hypothetical protein
MEKSEEIITPGYSAKANGTFRHVKFVSYCGERLFMALPTSNMRKEQWSYTQLVDSQSWGDRAYRLNKPDGRKHDAKM